MPTVATLAGSLGEIEPLPSLFDPRGWLAFALGAIGFGLAYWYFRSREALAGVLESDAPASAIGARRRTIESRTIIRDRDAKRAIAPVRVDLEPPTRQVVEQTDLFDHARRMIIRQHHPHHAKAELSCPRCDGGAPGHP